MCGIIGFFNISGAPDKVVQGLSIMERRGKDHFGLAAAGSIIRAKTIDRLRKDLDKKGKGFRQSTCCLGHNLHSVVANLPQPLEGKGLFAANSEVYNYKELSKRHGIAARNDSELIMKLIEKQGEKNIKNTLELLDGVYAIAYWSRKTDKVYIARDIIGVKPLWYSVDDGFCFASEKKALAGRKGILELNPREIIVYDQKTGKYSKARRKFFTTTPCISEKEPGIRQELKRLIAESIRKRIPQKKFGLLFSGGVDSTFLAKSFEDLGIDFTCYTAALEQPGLKPSEDLKFAQKAAQEHGFRLRTRTITLAESEQYLKKVVPLIEDNNVVKTGVALTFYVACEMAKEDGVKVIFSGLGSEEIFAGYERHKNSQDINQECLSGIRRIYERDLYRDDVITMANSMELRVPFLDRKLVAYALRIPNSLKLKKVGKQDDRQGPVRSSGRFIDKFILRKIAKEIGIREEFTQRPKKAAQYGSNFDKAILKLSKAAKSKNKSDYLKRFYQTRNVKLGALFSSGKDSTLAMWIMMRQNYEISCLISIQSRNPDSYMWHTPNIEYTKLQAEAMGIPILIQQTEGEKEIELKDLKTALKKAKKQFGIEGIVSGAVFSTYQRNRIEKIADELGLKLFSPLWHMDQALLMKYLLDNGFEVILSSIAADGLDRSWLGRPLTYQDLENLKRINRKIGINIAFEGGEAESFVIDAPFFRKRIRIIASEIAMETPIIGRYMIKKAELVNKNTYREKGKIKV